MRVGTTALFSLWLAIVAAPTPTFAQTAGAEVEVDEEAVSEPEAAPEAPPAESEPTAESEPAEAAPEGELAAENEPAEPAEPAAPESEPAGSEPAEPAASESEPAPDSEPPCLAEAVTIQRKRGRPRESIRVSLSLCSGLPNPAALVPLSVLGRAYGTTRPSAEDLTPQRRHWVAPGVRRLHRGLLSRLQAIANRWPGRTLTIVSGHRPRANRTSKHRVGRALDVRVEGVHRRRVSEFARTLAQTGVGFYPNSTFTHVDVRGRSTYWIDRSGPGERADYGPWPRPAEETERFAASALERALEAATALDAAIVDIGDSASTPTLAEVQPQAPPVDALPEETPDEPPLDPREVRDAAMAAIDRALAEH